MSSPSLTAREDGLVFFVMGYQMEGRGGGEDDEEEVGGMKLVEEETMNNNNGAPPAAETGISMPEAVAMGFRAEGEEEEGTKNKEVEESMNNNNGGGGEEGDQAPPTAAAARDWLSLDGLMLGSIMERLPGLRDISAFRGVSKIWRSHTTAGPTLQSPLILLTYPRPAFYNLALGRSYDALPSLAALLRTRRPMDFSHGHLLLVPNAEVPFFRSLLLYNPFTGVKTRVPKPPNPFTHPYVLSSSSLLLFNKYTNPQTLQLRPLVGGIQWAVHELRYPAWMTCWAIRDIISFKGRLYVLTIPGRLGVLDLDAPKPKLKLLEKTAQLTHPGIEVSYGRCRLAVSGGHLLLTCGMGVWRWDFARRKRVRMTSLGGWSLFLSPYRVAASLRPTVPGVRGDCIYYAGDYFDENWIDFPNEMGGGDFSLRPIFYAETCNDQWVVVSLIDGTFEVVSPSPAAKREVEAVFPPVWVFPSLCCPSARIMPDAMPHSDS